MARRRTRSSTQESAEVDMTPMLDIVFILLIFFIVTAVFLDERGLDFTKLDGDSAPTPVAAISITIDGDNQVAIEGQPVPLSFVEAEVQVLLVQKPNAAISLRAAERAHLQEVVAVKEKMERAGLTVSFETYAETQTTAGLE